jgi:hypothetical protein
LFSVTVGIFAAEWASDVESFAALAAVEEGYVQMPSPWIAWHVAPAGHAPFDPGVQISAHCVGFEEPCVSRTHEGLAVNEPSPFGHSFWTQSGEQKSPVTPVI